MTFYPTDLDISTCVDDLDGHLEAVDRGLGEGQEVAGAAVSVQCRAAWRVHGHKSVGHCGANVPRLVVAAGVCHCRTQQLDSRTKL
jgi:hypothetical protein